MYDFTVFRCISGIITLFKTPRNSPIPLKANSFELHASAPHPKDNVKWHDIQMNQYIFKSSRYPSTLIRVPGPVLVGLTLTRLCAGIITVPIKLEPTMNQVDSKIDFKTSLEILGHFLNTVNIYIFLIFERFLAR